MNHTDNPTKRKEMNSHELIMKLRERHQMEIFSSNELWCVHLFELDICPNDIGISCDFETSDESLHDALTEALEWSFDRHYRKGEEFPYVLVGTNDEDEDAE
ncbi:hypothetical protein [Bacillus velezensis]|uniref:hypothetical protein n=1 Tax=Bacillus velezensis TaxID=492670 RepID=UPI002798E428|nr:hypothetical protein [Bacillus velezensis]MEC2288560.1 hypothetical protein [Bacillus velezensis]MEC2422454.1 hypothetical protein [Bacillus velezensis]WFF76320.1 hypothetical protein P6282_21035 [Bacillus velezensis]WFF76396.1 hypothetical protein P6282_00420 [Bacillus velezensis]